MQEAYVSIRGVPTHIITWGKWVEESLDGVKEIVICITGNPGLPGFYTKFLGNLYKEMNSEIPIWVIGHLGHDDPPATSIREVPPLAGNESLFDLEGQVKHKLEFIEKFVPENVKIHLMGHSIGAFMILEILKQRNFRKRFQKCYFLFPTIERMLESPNGWTFTNIALPLYIVFGFLISLFNHLPYFVKLLFLRFYFWIFAIPVYFTGTAIKYSKPSVMEKVIFLAKDEMTRVRGLDRELIKENAGLIKFYYGTTDGWVPLRYYEELRQDIPNVDAYVDKQNIAHAFVLRSSRQMSVIMSNWIRENRAS